MIVFIFCPKNGRKKNIATLESSNPNTKSRKWFSFCLVSSSAMVSNSSPDSSSSIVTPKNFAIAFKESIFGSEANFNNFKARPSVKALQEDPMILFAKSVQAEKKMLTEALKGFDDSYNLAHKEYVKGLLAMHGDFADFPDANSTLRLTYGQVKGYSPRDCDYYGCQTTLDGVMEKEDSTNWEFVVPARLKELYQAKDFGEYAMPDGRMPVAFSATTHTTGGNSGSPVLNANGEMIGINFDRNWEGVGGDIQYLPDYQRSIIVDIRYVLFIIDKYANAGYLLKEMDIVE